MPIPEEAKKYFEEKLNADFVDDDGPFDYFEDQLYRLQMRQTNGNRELFYFYFVFKKNENIAQRNTLRSILTINTPEELAANLKDRIKNTNDKHQRIITALNSEVNAGNEKIRTLKIKISNLSGSTRNSITFLISTAAIIGIFSVIINELLKSGKTIEILRSINNPISISFYLFIVASLSFVFGGHLRKAVDVIRELFLNIRP